MTWTVILLFCVFRGQGQSGNQSPFSYCWQEPMKVYLDTKFSSVFLSDNCYTIPLGWQREFKDTGLVLRAATKRFRPPSVPFLGSLMISVLKFILSAHQSSAPRYRAYDLKQLPDFQRNMQQKTLLGNKTFWLLPFTKPRPEVGETKNIANGEWTSHTIQIITTQ